MALSNAGLGEALSYKLSPSEQEVVFTLASKLTNNYHSGEYRRDVLVNHVETRLHECGAPNLAVYLERAQADSGEFAQLMSALTIHTTEWFRELPHFAAITDHIKSRHSKGRRKICQILSLGCSSGEEVYSFGLALEQLRRLTPGLDYKITGWDVDPVSIQRATKAVYPVAALPQIPNAYLPLVMLGSGKSQGWFTLDPDIRGRCQFAARNLFQVGQYAQAYDVIICRNVLIYFSPEQVKTLIASFRCAIVSDGVICLGHSEAVTAAAHGLVGQGHAIYHQAATAGAAEPQVQPHTVPTLQVVPAPRAVGLPAADEPLSVLMIGEAKTTSLPSLLQNNGFAVTAAESADAATMAINTHAYALITLDIHVAGLDAAAWVRMIRSKGVKTPCVVISTTAAAKPGQEAQAMIEGVQDFISKEAIIASPATICVRIKELATGSRRVDDPTAKKKVGKGIAITVRPEVIVVGASTGGTEALSKLLQAMPSNCPPVVVVQHIVATFARSFAERLATLSQLKLGVPETGQPLKPGHLYLAFGDNHITVKRSGDGLMIFSSKEPAVHGHRPSVDYLFQGTAKSHAEILAILLTGMGKDGARGLKELKTIGAMTLAQDEASSVVYGMPKEAVQLGAVNAEGNLSELRSAILSACQKPARRKAG